ncbi:MAG: DNA-binding protein [Thermodesulfovibrionia bacterium]
MRYQIGSIGRMIIVRFDDGDNLLDCLINIAKTEDVRAGIIYLIGGMREGNVVVGPKRDEIPPEPMWWRFNECHEVMGIGTVFWQDNEPRIHIHTAFGKGDNAKVGCLRDNGLTFLVLEAVIMEINGVNAVREIDPVSGMSLLKITKTHR